ncbi:MAG: single-stranded DNA-binding protein [Candidatus Kapabacteria bacterium]|nr:single-stranded DNA-binding protein [Candidatus Kapabacteria bacterium]
MNKVIIIGNLGQDPDFRMLDSGLAICKLNVATSERYKDDQGEWKEDTEWHRVVLWRNLAETANKFLKKGSKVAIEGRLKTSSYEKDGITRYTTDIIANSIVFLDKSESTDYQSENSSKFAKSNGDNTDIDTSVADDDDLPF